MHKHLTAYSLYKLYITAPPVLVWVVSNQKLNTLYCHCIKSTSDSASPGITCMVL